MRSLSSVCYTPKDRVLPTFAAVLFLTFTGSVQAQFNYTIAPNLTITITGYTGPSGTLVVPSTLGGLPVTSIARGAFGNSGLTNITLPYTLTNFGVGGEAIANCSSLRSINVDLNNPRYSSAGGVLFAKTQSTLVQYPYAKAGPYTIPDSTTNIGRAAFANCVFLTSTTIPDGALNIGGYAFAGCTSLTNVNLGNAVKVIGEAAFQGTKLTSLAIPDGVTSIGSGAFAGCELLASVILPNSLSAIGDHAFYGSGLTSVTIPNSVTVIGASAFGYCANLINASIGNNVIFIGDGAFEYTKLASITIPGKVTSIGTSTFGNCDLLTTVTIGGGVASIGSSAFVSCSDLSGVYFEGLPPGADSTVFVGDNISTIYYLPGTPGWGSVFANRPTLPWLPQMVTRDSSLATKTNSFGFDILWATGRSVVIESSTDLARSVWVPLATNNLTTGSFYFADPHRTNYPRRFYRVHAL